MHPSTRLAWFAIPLLCSLLSAQGFQFTSFANTAGLSLVGSASPSSNRIRLTDLLANQTGAMWHATPQPISAGFDSTFSFRISPPISGIAAAGMAFVIHDAPAGNMSLGGSAWGLGYGSGASGTALPKSIAIEIDTFQDLTMGDSSANEISIHTRGTAGNDENEAASLGRISPSVILSDGQVHTMRIRYQPGALEIYVDNPGIPILTVPWDFATGGTWFASGAPVGGLGLTNGQAWCGFTATTAAGVLQQKTEILSWTFASNAGPPACFAGVVGATLGAPANVLTVNASNGGIQRRVQVPIYQPFAIQMANPPGAFSPSGFILFGHFGAADGSQSMDFGPAGALCFTVSLPNPQAGTFILTDGFNAGVPSLVPGHPAPWVFALGRGIPFTTTVTYQGVIVDPTNPAILSVTNAIILEYVVPPPPHIESISPAAALPGTIVTIQGQNFLANKSLSLNGVPIAPISSGSSTISFLYPANVPCDSVLTVSHPDGQSDSGLLNPSPVITNTVNGAGSSAGGAFFAIFGSGFVPNMTATVGGNPAAIVTQLPDLITVQAPVGTPGVAPVIITTPFGCSVSTIYTYF